MQISQNCAVAIDYTLTNPEGDLLDQSQPGQPLWYLHGNNNLIPGLEQELESKSANDTFTATVPPELGYGERDERFVQTVPRSAFEDVEQLDVGMSFQAESNAGPRMVVITDIQGDEITVDGNHPLAGVTLTFEVTVAEVREATAEEKEHGHVHQAGDCGHEH